MTVITATCERCAGRYGPDYMDGDVCVFCAAKLTRARLITQARQSVDQLHGSIGPIPRNVALLLDAVTWLIEAAELPEPGGGRWSVGLSSPRSSEPPARSPAPANATVWPGSSPSGRGSATGPSNGPRICTARLGGWPGRTISFAGGSAMSPDPAVEALIADGTWNASPLGACGVRRMVRGRVAEGLVRLVREADSAEPVRAALAELVALKDGPKDERYYERRPGAWDRARAALAADREPEPREEEGGRPDYVQRMRDLAESVGERNERIRMLREDQDA